MLSDLSVCLFPSYNKPTIRQNDTIGHQFL